VHGHVDAGEQRVEPRRRRLGDENVAGGVAGQRGLDQIGPLRQKPARTFATDVAVQLRRSYNPRRAFGE
jgi:hypothetical protein